MLPLRAFVPYLPLILFVTLITAIAIVVTLPIGVHTIAMEAMHACFCIVFLLGFFYLTSTYEFYTFVVTLLLINFFVSLIAAVWYTSLASEVIPGFGWFTSACGTSSCSYAQNQVVTYNPSGYLPANRDYLITCPFFSQTFNGVQWPCRWADNNGIYWIQGYGADQAGGINLSDPLPPGTGGLATSRPQDFPNLAWGLADGLFIGTDVTNVNLCPYNVPGIISPVYNLPSAGQPICPRCWHYFASNGYTNTLYNTYCNNTGPDTLCWACFPPDHSNPQYIAIMYWLLLGGWLAAQLWAIWAHLYETQILAKKR